MDFKNIKFQRLLNKILKRLSGEGSFINGVILPIDGGFSAYSGV